VELLESPVAFDAGLKTDAGKRTVAIPPHVLPVLADTSRHGQGSANVRRRAWWADAIGGETTQRAFGGSQIEGGPTQAEAGAHYPPFAVNVVL
jgi:hypothetical protein